jgi:mRNA-degrading endonuclease RelE of RelBE toxin-antitoxin system
VAYRIIYTREADADLADTRRRDGAGAETAIRHAIPRYLADEPAVNRGARKALDPNPLDASWRLRLGAYRVLYDVDEDAGTVTILRVGHKPRESLYLRGQLLPMRVD